MGKWSRSALLVVTASLCIAIGCLAIGVSKDDGGDTAPDADSAAPTVLSLMLDGPPNALHAFIFAADKQGYFKEQGLSLTIRVPDGTADPLQRLADGHTDLVLADQPGVILARAGGLHVQSVAALIPKSMQYLLVPRTSSVHAPKHLDGLRVGYAGRTAPMVLQTMLRHDDAGEIAVEQMPIPFGASGAFRSRQIDAFIGDFVIRDSLYLEASGIPVRSVDPRLYGVPDYYGMVLAAKEEAASERREAFQKVLHALDKGRRFVMDHPEQGVRYVMEAADDAALEYGLELQSLQGLIGLWSDPEYRFGDQDAGSWKEAVQWLEDFAAFSRSDVENGLFVDLIEAAD